ncbi:hypothetical protein G8770_07225 [Aestuariicella hydrocarbonica]|uniref:Uncharacterized protein n=1 Tax=Pseudomaricurvus hydrocarbonicus TaxID=1470433 RepID=A0A9E5MM30_9GAMM|nr:hypothetical protein [Aestuariicella hydrocarbonica]NHO65330.1 hypothetical protein [Aestuariicella hydrocarbonica]
MSREEEMYVHFQDCLAGLNRAWAIFSELELDRMPPVLVMAAFNMGVIEYSKPFKESYRNGKKRHSLGLPLASEDDHLLHQYLLGLRDHALDHSESTVEGAAIYEGKDEGFRFPVILSEAHEKWPPIREIKLLIEKVLDVYYAQLPQLLKQL